MKTSKFFLSTLIAAAAMTANAYAEIDSELGTLEWTTAPSTAANFYSGDYGLTFNFTEEVIKTLDADKSYVLAAYWGGSGTSSYGANALVLNYSSSSDTWTLQIGRGYLSDTDLTASTTFTFQDSVTFTQAISVDTAYTLSVTGGNQAMTPTLSWGDSSTETLSSYAGNMNGYAATMNYGLLNLYYITDSVWGGGETGNWSDASWTTGSNTNQSLGAAANVTFNSSATMTATEAVAVNSITLAADQTLTLAGTGKVSSGDLNNSGTIAINSESTLSTMAATTLGTITGSGRLELGTGDATPGSNFTSETWTGTVAFVDATESNLSVSSYGNKNSTVAFNGFTGYFAEGNNGTIVSDIAVEGSLTINDGWSGATLTFSGEVSGEGTFAFTKGNTQKFAFTNNVDLATMSFSGGSATFSGNTTNIDSLSVNGTTLDFSGTSATIGNYTVAGGTENAIASTLSLDGSLWVKGATLNLDDGANVTATQLRMAEQGASTMNINSGAVLTITGSNNEQSTGASLLLAHWGHTTTLTLNGGKLVASDADMNLSWTGTGTFSAQSGEARVKGIDALDQCWGGTHSRGAFILGATDSGDAKVYIGSSGISAVNDDASVRLGEGTLGATADWSSSGSNAFSLVGTVNGTIFNTENPDDATGHTITINNVLAGDGKLAKQGAGTLKLSGNNTYSGGTTVSAGTLVAASENALGSGDVSVADNAKLSLGTESVTINNLSGAGDVDLADGTSAATLTINSTKDTSFSGNIGSHVLPADKSKVFSLIKEGSGTFALAEGTIEDLSVKAGTFVTNAGIYADSVSVSDGATLKVVPVEFATYAGSFEFASGAQLLVDLGNLAVPADANANNAVIAVDVIAAEVIKFGDVTLSQGDSITLPDGYVTFANPGILETYVKQTWSYDGGVLSLTLAIPEPSLFGLLAGLGALTLVGTRRRRSKKA